MDVFFFLSMQLGLQVLRMSMFSDQVCSSFTKMVQMMNSPPVSAQVRSRTPVQVLTMLF
jgi:hypothetical protein